MSDWMSHFDGKSRSLFNLTQFFSLKKNQEKFIFKHKTNEQWVNIETLQNISHVYDTKITV